MSNQNNKQFIVALDQGTTSSRAIVLDRNANVVTIAISERSPQPITTGEWMRIGLPVMLITCTMASISMIIFHGTLYSS